MNNKQIKLGIILQYLQMGIGIIIQLIYTPFMIRILGDTEYGIYSLVSSIITYLNLLSLGFGASYIRFYSRYKKEEDYDSIAKLNGLYIIVFLAMGIVALIAGLVLAFNVNVFFNDTYTNSDLELAKILMLFLAFNMFISFPASVFVSYITSQEKFVFQKLVNIGKTVLSPVLSIVLLLNGYGSIGMVVITTCVSLLIDLINVGYCLGKLKMKISFRNLKFPLLKEIAAFSFFIAINQIIDQINWQTDKIILGKMINATAVAIYSVGATINTMYISFSTAISSVFTPRIHRIENATMTEEEKNKEYTTLFIKVGRIQFFILSLILTGFIFFGQYFIYKWAGEKYELAYYIALLLICPVTISLCQNLGIEIQRAKNKHQFRSILYLIMAALNVGISILFCYLWGNIGTAIGTTISLLMANGLIMNIYYQKKLGINVILFWKSIVSIIPSMIIPIVFGTCIMIFYKFHNLYDFAALIIAYTIIYAVSIYIFGINKEEKAMVKNIFRRVLKK